MTTLEKARLQEITSDRAARPIGDPVEVQFNPTSLRLRLSNSNEGGRSRGRQTRQHMGASSTTLSMDLIFDTADEGQTQQPRSVHEKTALVEKFVLPKENGDAPPKLRFQWGNLLLDGVVESLDIEFDHFAASGVPLRAKVGLSIKGQDPKYEFLETGPGARDSAGAREPGGLASNGPAPDG
ncbi:MAG: hypothetical protein J5I93_07465, partial [Pirellulaceae bacterium]|nr:hypothetical protein [Pirellulaceae bacterium]